MHSGALQKENDFVPKSRYDKSNFAPTFALITAYLICFSPHFWFLYSSTTGANKEAILLLTKGIVMPAALVYFARWLSFW